MAVEIDVVYQGDLHCEARHGPSGATLLTDAPTDNGGKGEAFSPTDLCATSLGSCVVTTMGLLANRIGVDIAGTKVHVVKEMVADPVRRIGALLVTVTFPPGKSYSPEDRKRLEGAAWSCPVKRSLHPDLKAPITFVYPE